MRRNRYRNPQSHKSLLEDPDSHAASSYGAEEISLKLVSCDQILGLYRAFGGETTRGAINLYLVPLKNLILSNVLHNRMPAWSINGEIPEWILSPYAETLTPYQMDGLHLRTTDLVTAIETCRFATTKEGGIQGYHGGDIDTPFRNALKAGHDYLAETGLKLMRFNLGWESIEGGSGDEEEEEEGLLGKDSMLKPRGGPLITHPR